MTKHTLYSQLTPDELKTLNAIKRACARSRYGQVRASHYPAAHVAELARIFLIHAECPGPGWPRMLSICDDPESGRQTEEKILEAVRESLTTQAEAKYKYQTKPKVTVVTVVFVESGYPHWEVAKWDGPKCIVGPEWFVSEAEARSRASELDDLDD